MSINYFIAVTQGVLAIILIGAALVDRSFDGADRVTSTLIGVSCAVAAYLLWGAV